MLHKIKILFSGNKLGRTHLMFKNVILSFFTKGGIAVIGILMVPMMLQLLSKEEFGIWQTLSSMLGWLYFLDIGLSNGFKNLFTQAIAEKQIEKANKFLSTTYAIIIFTSLFFVLVFECVNPFLDWGKILNFNQSSIPNFPIIIQLVFLSFAFKLALSILNTALASNQQYSASTVIELITQICIIGFLYFLIQVKWPSLFMVAMISSVAPIVLLVLASVYYFNVGSLSAYRPTWRNVDLVLSGQLFSKGVQFFFIQIAFVLMFTANNIIVAQLFGPEQVAELSVVSKYYSIPIMAFVIVLGPFWAGFTEAYYKNEISWVQITIKRLLAIWVLFLLLIWTMYWFFEPISIFWLGNHFKASSKLVFYYAVFASVVTFNNIFSYFLNGIGKIRVQLIGAIFLGIISIPLSVYFCNLPFFEADGVLAANIVCLLLGVVLGPLQYYLIITKKAKGVWLK